MGFISKFIRKQEKQGNASSVQTYFRLKLRRERERERERERSLLETTLPHYKSIISLKFSVKLQVFLIITSILK